MKTFKDVLFESVLEYYIHVNGLHGIRRYQSPKFYSRRNELSYTYFLRDSLELRNTETLSEEQILELKNLISGIKGGNIDLQKYILALRPDYSFLFYKELEAPLKDPEFFSMEEDIPLIVDLLNKDPENFFVLQAYVIYYYNKGDLGVESKFKKILEIDKDNPYVLARYSRYLGSAMYKKDRDKKILEESKNHLKRAIEIQGEDAESYLFSWLGYVEFELQNYEKAYELIEKAVSMNSVAGAYVSDPIFWKALVLSKMGRSIESIELCISMMNDVHFNKNGDFRFFRLLASNYCDIDDMHQFKIYLRKTIEVFLEKTKLLVIIQSDEIDLGAKKQPILFNDFLLKNRYSSFIEYNTNYISDDIDRIIYDLAFLELVFSDGIDITFKLTRDIEKLCFKLMLKNYGE